MPARPQLNYYVISTAFLSSFSSTSERANVYEAWRLRVVCNNNRSPGSRVSQTGAKKITPPESFHSHLPLRCVYNIHNVFYGLDRLGFWISCVYPPSFLKPSWRMLNLDLNVRKSNCYFSITLKVMGWEEMGLDPEVSKAVCLELHKAHQNCNAKLHFKLT